MLQFIIGDTLIKWEDGGYPLEVGEYTSRFLVSDAEASEIVYKDEICYQSAYLSLEEYENCEIIMENILCTLYNCKGKRLLAYHWMGMKSAVGYWLEDLEESTVRVFFHPDMAKAVPVNADKLFGMIGLHDLLLQRSAPILHASYIAYKGRAVLFTAPSQTGKSTQAALWKEHAGAEIMNGDRVLLRERDGVWYAYGYPCCGSSDICVNQTLPLEKIVILEQGETNKVQTVTAAAALRALVTATEIYFWDVEEINQAFIIGEKLIEKVIKLTCKPDADAVQVLKDYLEGDTV